MKRKAKVIVCQKCGHARLIPLRVAKLTRDLRPVYVYAPDPGCPAAGCAAAAAAAAAAV